MKVTLGRTVIARGIQANGSVEQAAIVTRAWSEQDLSLGPVRVNLTVFPDMEPPRQFGSVLMFETRDQATAYEGTEAVIAFFPDRA